MLIAATMRRLRHYFSALLVLCVLLYAAGARAQSIVVVNKAALLRFTPDGKQVTNRRPVNPEAFNFEDCAADQSIEFVYQASAFAVNQTLQVWAGNTDCKPATARSGATQQCWRPAANLPLQQTGTVRIPLRNIIAQPPTKDGNVVTPSASVCSNVPDTKFGLYFMFVQGASEPTGTVEQVDIQVKTQGPGALSGVTVLPGNRRLTVTWAAAGEAGVVDQQGVRVYCDPAPVKRSGERRTETTCVEAGAACGNAALDGTETDVDCGGSCGKCADGKTCKVRSDCTSDVCTDGKCAPVVCNDGTVNGTEVDVDCGGDACPRCEEGRNCVAPIDCKSGICTAFKCGPAVVDAGGDSAVCTTKEVSVPTEVRCESSLFGGTSTTSDAGSDGGSVASTTVVPDARYICGQVGAIIGGRIVISRLTEADENSPLLENDKDYAVSIVAVDSFGNPGTLSTPQCAMPGETSDFWQLYRDSGGQAGGCSMESAPIGGLISLSPLVVLVGALVRRRVRNRRTDSK